MAATFNESQKIDYLWKKVGYGVTKTAEPESKQAFNESIASPLLYRGDLIWTQSGDIPGVPPADTTSLVQVYKDGGGAGYSPTVQCTEDLTAPDNQTWKTNLANWIPTQFGDNYLVQIYAAAPGITNAQTVGTKLFGAGSGSDDTWFFDYQSGVLNFNGATIPTAIGTGTANTIYVVGYRYVGAFGVDTTFISNGTSNVTIATANGNITMAVNGTGDVVVVDNYGINISGNITATGNIWGGGVRSTASGTEPTDPGQGDIWYNTDTDVVYRYTFDGTSYYWIDFYGSTLGQNANIVAINNGATSVAIPTISSNINFTVNGSAVASFTSTGLSVGNTFFRSDATSLTLTNPAGGNVSFAGLNSSITGNVISAVANVAAGWVSTAGVDSSGNITGGNLRTGGVISSSGNITSGGLVSATGSVTGGNLFTGGVVSATGNVNAANLIAVTSVSTSSIEHTGSNGVGNIGSATSYFDGIFVNTYTGTHADLAENYQSDQPYTPGTVVVFGGTKEITISGLSHDTRVAGVVSSNPAFIMNGKSPGLLVALAGRVPTYVLGPVSKGDRLVNTASGVAGRIDLALAQFGCVLGKSLEDHPDAGQVKLIEVAIGKT